MNLEKAIEILEQDLTYTYPAKFDDLQAAVRLGSEASKRLQVLRQFPSDEFWHKLPGETEE